MRRLEEVTNAWLQASPAGMSPERVLVFEVAHHIKDFKKAVHHIGMSWLFESAGEEREPSERFYLERKKTGEPWTTTDSPLTEHYYFTSTNARAVQQVIARWRDHAQGQLKPRNNTKWMELFSMLKEVRYWSAQDRLSHSYVLENWASRLELSPQEPVRAEAELWWRGQGYQDAASRFEDSVAASGGTILQFSIRPEIAYHAALIELPPDVARLAIHDQDRLSEVAALACEDVLLFQGTGQTAAPQPAESEETSQRTTAASTPISSGSPVVAALDGYPLANHALLAERVDVLDPDNLGELIEPEHRVHGTEVASIILAGEEVLSGDTLQNRIVIHPVLKPTVENGSVRERLPDDQLSVDYLHRAILNVLDAYPTVRVFNVSIGDEGRHFLKAVSPLARLLDWISWERRVLFVVSAGNYTDDLELQEDVSTLDADGMKAQAVKSILRTVWNRQVLSPADSLNALTVGAANSDACGEPLNLASGLVLPLQSMHFMSPLNRIGWGFKGSVSPEVLYPGGRQPYRVPLYGVTGDSAKRLTLSSQRAQPGLRVAIPGRQGLTDEVAWSRGTSFAAASATRLAALFLERLHDLRTERGEFTHLDPSYDFVLAKCMLIHGARWGREAIDYFENAGLSKADLARTMGFGIADPEFAIGCLGNRATVIASGGIAVNEQQDFEIPLPPCLSGATASREVVASLAWISPTNPNYPTQYSCVRCEVVGVKKGTEFQLEEDEVQYRKSKLGTVQHRVLRGSRPTSVYDDGKNLRVRVKCLETPALAGADMELDDLEIPFGLAVTVSAEADLPIYNELASRLAVAVPVSR